MRASRAPSAVSLPLALWHVARRDLIAKLTIGAFALLAVLQVVPLLTAGQRAAMRQSTVIDLPFFVLILLACWVGLRRTERRAERRFWILLSVAYLSWMLASVVPAYSSSKGLTRNSFRWARSCVSPMCPM